MPRFVIERVIPGAGRLSQPELQAILQKSCAVLSNMRPQIQWIESCATFALVRPPHVRTEMPLSGISRSIRAAHPWTSSATRCQGQSISTSRHLPSAPNSTVKLSRLLAAVIMLTVQRAGLMETIFSKW